MKFKILTILVILFSANIFAQFGMQENLVSLKVYQSQDKVHPGTQLKVAVKFNIEETWHINSNKPKEDYLIPTVLSIASENQAFNFAQVGYPAAKDLTFEFSETPLSVYEGEAFISGLLNVPEELKPGEYKATFKLDYQACNDATCLAPTSVEETVTIIVAAKNEPLTDTNKEIFSSEVFNLPKIEPAADGSSASEFESSGLFLSLLIVFLGGLALNLTPCVYPLIPITVGYFGGQSEGSTGRLAALGTLYVLGMAITYSTIGVITALSGAVFGALMQNTFVLIGIALVLVLLSLSMFGVYEFKLPDSLVAKAGGAKGGLFGALFMGLTMGIVAAPCIGPFVLGLVTYVGAKGDPVYGFMMFFFLALGLGLPYMVLAIFSGKIKKLPRAGFWMDAVKHIFGFVLIGMALYFLDPILPGILQKYLLPVYMIFVAFYLLFIDKAASAVKGFRLVKVTLSLIIIAAAVYMLIPKQKNAPQWTYFSDEVYSASLSSNQPMIIDFYADWCIPCKELDSFTFSDLRVIDETKRFNTIKVDMTKSLSAETERLRNKFKIVGMPTVLVLNSNGEEVKRITGFVTADEFLNVISSVQ